MPVSFCAFDCTKMLVKGGDTKLSMFLHELECQQHWILTTRKCNWAPTKHHHIHSNDPYAMLNGFHVPQTGQSQILTMCRWYAKKKEYLMKRHHQHINTLRSINKHNSLRFTTF